MILKLLGIGSAALALLLGLMVHASPTRTDQLVGKLIIGGAVAVIALGLFVDRPWVRVVLALFIAGVVAMSVYIWLKWSGRL